MNGLPGILTVLAFVSALLSTVAGGYAYRHRQEPGATAFIVLMIGASVWSSSYGLALLVADPTLYRVLEVPRWLGRVAIPVAWFAFALEYTGRGKYVTKELIAGLAVVPAITIGVVLLDPSGLMWHNYQTTETLGVTIPTYPPGVWLYWQAAFAYALIGIGGLIIFGMMFSPKRLYRDQAVALLLGTLVPTVTSLKWILQLGPYPRLDFTPITLGITGVSFGYALFRYELLGLAPAIHRIGQRAIDDLGEGIVIVETSRRIVDMNTTAERLFDAPRTELLGRTIDSAIEADVNLDAEDQSLQLRTPQGRREFEVTSSPIRDQHERPIGHVLLVHDVTRRERRRQRIEVLNRVLRHNLRNDVNVIQGRAEMLVDRVDGDESELAARIERKSNELVRLGEKARQIESVVDSDDRAHRKFTVRRVLREVSDRLRTDYPEGDLTCDAPPDLWLDTDERLVKAIVSNLAENALQHNDAPESEVTVSVTAIDSTGVEIVVADDGPGIPEQERAVIEEGGETPLQHGTGLGLWLVKWGVGVLGGDLAIETREPRGTIVTVVLPNAAVESTAKPEQ